MGTRMVPAYANLFMGELGNVFTEERKLVDENMNKFYDA